MIRRSEPMTAVALPLIFPVPFDFPWDIAGFVVGFVVQALPPARETQRERILPLESTFGEECSSGNWDDVRWGFVFRETCRVTSILSHPADVFPVLASARDSSLFSFCYPFASVVRSMLCPRDDKNKECKTRGGRKRERPSGEKSVKPRIAFANQPIFLRHARPRAVIAF